MSQIGRYEIVRKTGNHGLDALYDAFDPVMKRTVTIRMPDPTADPGIEPAPTFDLRQIAELDHPNIVKILAIEEADEVPFLVLEQAEGTPLSQILADGKELPGERVIALLKGASAALDHVHTRGLVHGHLSAESLLLSEEGLLKVSGFELASPADTFHSNSAGVHPEGLVRAVPYMSPELILGDPVDGRADQFSLACIALQAMTGTLPFPADSPVARMRQILFENPHLGTGLAEKFPPAVGKVLEKALAKAPAARFPSCVEFVTALDAACIARPVSAPTRFVSPAPAPRPGYPGVARGAKSQRLLIGAATLAAILVVVIAYFSLRAPAAKSPRAIVQPVVQAPAIPVAPPIVPAEKPPVAVVKSGPAPAKKRFVRDAALEVEPETKVKPVDPTVPKP